MGSLGREDPLEGKVATHSSILAWRISWTEEPGGLQSMGLQSWMHLSTEHTHSACVYKTHSRWYNRVRMFKTDAVVFTWQIVF